MKKISFILFLGFLSNSCNYQDKGFEVVPLSNVTKELHEDEINSIAKKLSKSKEFLEFVDLIQNKNKKYEVTGKSKFKKNLLKTPEEISNLLTDQNSVNLVFKEVYLNPKEEIDFFQLGVKKINELQLNFKKLDSFSANDRIKVFNLAFIFQKDDKVKTQKKLRTSDCGGDCSRAFAQASEALDFILGAGMLACVWGTEGLGYFACLAATSYAYDYGWNVNLDNLATCFLRCAEP